jgi:hypothetical protein
MKADFTILLRKLMCAEDEKIFRRKIKMMKEKMSKDADKPCL